MDDAHRLQYLFQTLGEANRLKIIKFIGDKERSVSEIVEATHLSQPLVSHHLRILRQRDILETKRNGPFIYYKLKDTKLLDALGLFLGIASTPKGKRTMEPMFCCPPWWRKGKKKL
ncbi:MAG: metalloregulator ArsR/SmtB family transcription factor [Candidatus Aminicenantes bacterium]|nr:metalloregulator ArsR/SmtB family transcription factor [Candidatus Aminicenantes bacterium]